MDRQGSQGKSRMPSHLASRCGAPCLLLCQEEGQGASRKSERGGEMFHSGPEATCWATCPGVCQIPGASQESAPALKAPKGVQLGHNPSEELLEME